MKKHILIIFISIVSIFNLFSQKVIEMEQENGVYYVPCKVNGVPMKFVFDTGASDVSISLTEAKFLIKQGLLKDIDIKKSVKYQIANGDIQEGTKIILREINIDGIIINDVEASIIHNLEAPLLLGQSAISKLGRIKLDGNKLIIDSLNANETKFINIDFNKNLKEYFEEKELEMPDINSMSLLFKVNSLVKNNTHFLKKYNFDEESAEFDKKGKLYQIMLSKKSINTDDEFSKLVIEINKKYGNFTESSDKIKIWERTNFKVMVLKLAKTVLVICERKEKLSQIEISRNNWLETLNKYYKSADKNRKDVNRFARIEGNNLSVYIQSDLKTNPYKSEIEKEWIMFLFYHSSYIILNDEDFNKILINELMYENIILNIELTYYGMNRVKSSKRIRKSDINRLRVPFTEGELMDIIY